MTVLSVLRGAAVPTARKALVQCAAAQVRQMGGHGRLMNITPSRFQWNKFKDMVHLYVVGVGAPLLLGVFLVNIYVGPGSLTEMPDPEEKAPEEWEYHKSPITRFLVRYVCTSEQMEYEKRLQLIWEIYHKRDLRLIETEVRELMQERGDYKAWSYVPYISGKYRRIVRESTDRHAEERTAFSWTR